MNWLTYLHSNGISVAKSLVNSKDCSVFPFVYQDESLWGCLFEHTEGLPINKEPFFYKWGRQVASLHCLKKPDIRGRRTGFEMLER
ncbi:hypothetical protein HNO89_001419 [Sporosarcina luteola]|nr:hypothetical protein [Sporosarcina luteola]